MNTPFPSSPAGEQQSAGRVLLIAPQPFLEWRGSPLRIDANVRALAALGVHVDLLVMPFGTTPPDLPPEVRVFRPGNPFRLSGIAIGPSAWKAVYDVLLILKARRLLARHRYAALHGVEEAGAIAGWLGARHRIPVIFEKHSDPASYRKRGLRNLVMAGYARIERYAIRKAAAVIATGAGLADDVRRAAPGKPVYHIFDLPSSQAEADPDEVARLRARFAPRPECRVAAYAGSFAVYQNIDLLWQAIPRVLARCAEARFVIVGGTPQEIARLRAGGLGDERIHFVGRVPPVTLPNILGAADVLLSPRAGGRNTPLKVLDYLKAGRPIVASDSEANRLLLNHDVARLTPPEAGAFAEAVVALMRDDALRATMGRAARERVEQAFSFREFTRRLGTCYSTLGLPVHHKPPISEPAG